MTTDKSRAALAADTSGTGDGALVGALDLATKVRLLTGASAFTLAPQESVGFGAGPSVDGPTGVRGLKFSGGPTVALLPNATLLASAWSEDAAYEVGQILAEEALAQQVHVVLGPTINLHRSPLGGRLFEAYSEDPLLTGKLAAAYVRGLQGSGVGACLKHLVANESETERNTVNSVVDEATLRELYLLPFEIAVAESAPGPSWPPTTTSTGSPRPSSTTSTTRSAKASGFRRTHHVRLVRHQDRRDGRERWPRPGHARPRRPVG